MNTPNGEAMVVADENTEIETRRVDASTLGVATRSEIDTQVTTARAYPRSVTACLREATALATLDEETAASMFYVLPRGGKNIEGPSARLAEVMSYAWGNIRSSAEVVGADDKFVIAEGVCFDCEKNVAVKVRVKRRITDKYGKRYNDDMITVTGNAATSIALRNAVFKVIPTAFVNRIYAAARSAAIGKGTMASKRERAFSWFKKVGKQPEDIFALLGVKGEEDIGEDELIELRGIVTAIQEGETTVEAVFRKHDKSDGAADLNAALKGSGQAKAEDPPAEEDPPEEPRDEASEEVQRASFAEILAGAPAGADTEAHAVYIEEHGRALTKEEGRILSEWLRYKKANAQKKSTANLDDTLIEAAKKLLREHAPEGEGASS